MSKGNIFEYERVRSPDMTEQMALIDAAFAIGKAYSLTTSTTLVEADFGKSIRINSALDLTITFPGSLATDEDGAKLSFTKHGTGSLTLKSDDADYIHSYSVATDKTSSIDAAISYQYDNSLTRWVVVCSEGTWAST